MKLHLAHQVDIQCLRLTIIKGVNPNDRETVRQIDKSLEDYW